MDSRSSGFRSLVALIGATVLVRNLFAQATSDNHRRPAISNNQERIGRELPTGAAPGTQLSVSGITWSDRPQMVPFYAVVFNLPKKIVLA